METLQSEANFVIKDLDTGRQYVLTPEADGGGAAAEVPAAGGVADPASGKVLSMDEFDRQLGIRSGRSAIAHQGDVSSSDGDSPRASDAQSSASTQTGQGFSKLRKLPKLKGIKTLLKTEATLSKKIQGLRGSLTGKRDGQGDSPKQDGQVDSPVSSSGGSPQSQSNSPGGAFAQREESDPSLMSPIPAADRALPASAQLESPLARCGTAGFGSTKVGHTRRPVKEVSDLRLVQELKGHKGVVWTARFSPDGTLLASGGKDAVVRIWEVISKRANKEKEKCCIDLPVFRQDPVRVWKGHHADILNIAWSSESQFVLSASLDKGVRLWHITKDQCLREFQHQNWVTSIKFHPKDANQFISGGGDGLLRMWNVMERRVVASASIAADGDMYTALTFSDDAKMIAAGTFKGKCRLYEVNGKRIEKRAQIDVRNRRGRHSKGKRITGMEYIPIRGQQSLLLVTSNDSRIRLFQGLTEVMKFKGHTNNVGLPISASHSPQGDYIICGSEEGRAYIWSNSTKPLEDANSSKEDMHMHSSVTREKVNAYEWFRAHDGYATVALLAPDTCRRPLADLENFVDQEGVAAAASTGRFKRTSRHTTNAAGHAPAQANHGSAGQEAVNGGGGESYRLWGQVIVTAGGDGEIRVWENFGFPVNLSG
ncbi:unnamed protein product [Ostreobium quekettii]|uniref:WD40 repeat-like protein n=1 Tax=Ostreobium quekettii TaxID=121088 RepID=A0A8S1ISQ4_9CHLO|nr:unnamed protein product [Ostreobium quekettii]|eukprot:evm.model.scf_1258.5 EVM.evm.TU.scf_1258.5   scf_1258:25091-33015(+)